MGRQAFANRGLGATIEPKQMDRLNLSRGALSVAVAAALLAGCGALPLGLSKGQDDTALPISAPGAMVLPEARSSSLLYVSDDINTDIYMFSYPKGRPVGTLTGFTAPRGLCVDRSGNVFITDQGASDIVEYAHGGTKPINTLKDPRYPLACSVDRSTGNLAVVDERGSVSIYPGATGQPTVYSVPFVPWFCAYDDAGNLFADSSGAPAIQIAKLPSGGKAFEKIAYDQRNNGQPAGLQWIGNRLEVGSASPYEGGCCGRIYHFAINGAHGRRAGKTLIRGALDNLFIEGSTAIAATLTHRVAYYDYPEGGHATKTIREPGYESYSVVVSDAPR